MALFSITPFMCLAPILTMVAQRHHILMALLSLEAMILSLSFFITISSYFLSLTQAFLILIILTFGACEASLGLACLVLLTRSSGSSNMNALNLTKC